MWFFPSASVSSESMLPLALVFRPEVQKSLSASHFTVVVFPVYVLLLLLLCKETPPATRWLYILHTKSSESQNNTSSSSNIFDSTCMVSCRPTQKARNGCFYPTNTHVSVCPLVSQVLSKQFVASAHSYPYRCYNLSGFLAPPGTSGIYQLCFES